MNSKRTGRVRTAVNTKITAEIRAELEASAAANGLTLSAEIERRLLASLGHDAPTTVAKAVEAAVERAFARRDEPVAPLGSPPPAYAQ